MDTDDQASRAPGALIPHKRFAQDLGVCSRTLSDRAKTDPDFPPIVRYNHRKFYEEHACQDYKRKLLRRAVTATAIAFLAVALFPAQSRAEPNESNENYQGPMRG